MAGKIELARGIRDVRTENGTVTLTLHEIRITENRISTARKAHAAWNRKEEASMADATGSYICSKEAANGGRCALCRLGSIRFDALEDPGREPGSGVDGHILLQTNIGLFSSRGPLPAGKYDTILSEAIGDIAHGRTVVMPEQFSFRHMAARTA